MAEPITITLRHPITFAGKTIDHLTIRPIRAKDLRRIKDTDSQMASTLNMASWLSGEVSQVIDELEGQDLSEVLDVVNRFFHDINRTTETSSGS
jgi:hypothetical protein